MTVLNLLNSLEIVSFATTLQNTLRQSAAKLYVFRPATLCKVELQSATPMGEGPAWRRLGAWAFLPRCIGVAGEGEAKPRSKRAAYLVVPIGRRGAMAKRGRTEGLTRWVRSKADVHRVANDPIFRGAKPLGRRVGNLETLLDVRRALFRQDPTNSSIERRRDLSREEFHLEYPRFAEAEIFDVVLEPGEALLIPVGWWHHVRSLDISINVSLTNFLFGNDSKISARNRINAGWVRTTVRT
ncbi:cupin-like domain-containing protein [Bradyrhizobium lupini]|uniref:cupin-like domain-containing protein n=1 Tax=Rhizobium lupini TaxID=136996 RepID=UPI00366A7C46